MTQKPKKVLYNFDMGGKMQPSDSDMEDAVLGAMLLQADSFDLIIPILKEKHFYKEQNGLIYRAMIEIAQNNGAIDILTVTKQLKINGTLEIVGGSYYVSSLTDRIASAANIETHARIIIQNYMLREMILIGTNMIKQAYEDQTDPFELIDWSGAQLSALLDGIESKNARSIGAVKEEIIESCKEALTSEKQNGVPISINSMQNHTNGWRPGNLIVLAGRPGMGKTAVALDYAYYPATQGLPTAVFSLEMTAQELTARVISRLSHISSQKINNHATDTYELSAIIKDAKTLDGVPLYIDDTPSLSIQRLRSKAFRLVREKGIKLIVVDYLQLMEGADEDSFNREQEISKITRGLKKLARELEIPIIALSQLSRETEKRVGGAKRPQLSDLRESGSIEQDADMIIFLLRPEYYGITEYEHGGVMLNTHQLLVQIIAKYRNGALADIKTRWIGSTTSITDWDKNPEIENNSPKQPELPLSSSDNLPF